MEKHDFLFELGCEELPAKKLPVLSAALQSNTMIELEKVELSFSSIETFATPRRLGLLIKDLSQSQSARTMVRQGPKYEQAFDKNGAPTLSLLGFVKACNTSLDHLEIKETPKGKHVFCTFKKEGEKATELLPALINNAIKNLPLGKTMRWGSRDVSFLRPVHWAIMLYGQTLVQAKIVGKNTSRSSFGHRFHSPQAIPIDQPQHYAELLKKHYVLVNFEARKQRIRELVHQAEIPEGKASIEDHLLEEVTGLVEWPVIYVGHFDPRFLKIPKEVLITSMKIHQKCFPVAHKNGDLLPYFIIVSNIDSRKKEQVIVGNERVINARLSDALFFFETDQKQPLESHLKALAQVIFQKDLGSLADKTKRLKNITKTMAESLKINKTLAEKASNLSKCDLLTQMVNEFPELQGIMGYYYALCDKESLEVALALRDQYRPAFSGDNLPETSLGCALALADKLDLLVGILGVNKKPTGDKDPFALRRAALGIVRILIEKKLPLNVKELLQKTKQAYGTQLPNKKVVEEAQAFILDRLKAYYNEKGISSDIFEAVSAVQCETLIDFDERIQAVRAFKLLPEANSLASANKRVSNILKKITSKPPEKIQISLCKMEAELNLYHAIQQKQREIKADHEEGKYTEELYALASLKEVVDTFFDQVMVMDNNPQLRNNRLALLKSLHSLFSQVADIALLQS